MNSTTIFDLINIYDALIGDSRVQNNLDWGKSRPGHTLGTLRLHIQELEYNLEQLWWDLSYFEYWQLRILAVVHDICKPDARRGSAITDPDSHASLAKKLLAEYYDDHELLQIVQYHDKPYSMWRKSKFKRKDTSVDWIELGKYITNWRLFIAFNLIDNCTLGKSNEPLLWLLKWAPKTCWTTQHIDRLVRYGSQAHLQ